MSGRQGRVVVSCRDKEWVQSLLPGLVKYTDAGRNVFVTDRAVKVDRPPHTPYDKSEADTGRGGQSMSA